MTLAVADGDGHRTLQQGGACQPKLGIRWTIGNASAQGFEALRLSIWGAWKLFGLGADYRVCTNRIAPNIARALAGNLPGPVVWRDTTEELPQFLRAHVDPEMAEGVAWKLAPIRVFPDQPELALDNDCILWRIPSAIRRWLHDRSPTRTVLAEDMVPAFGQFAENCGTQPRNSGIRGLPPGWDYEAELRRILSEHPVTLRSELDEQGLQAAALSRTQSPLVVRVQEVTICSPFPPHVTRLGRCGAHFCGLNIKEIPWQLDGRGASEYIRENWFRHRAALYQRTATPNNANRSE